MKICELFYSIQGESTFSGMPCIFIRTSGCNLRCSYCDTKFAYEEEGYEISPEKVLKNIKEYNCRLLEVTGGEPLLQEEIYDLIEMVLEENYNVLLETNGSLLTDKVPEQVIKIVDIKCPESGQSNLMNFENLNYLKKKDHVKFVLTDKADYEWAKGVISDYNLIGRTNILVSPACNILDIKKLAEWILKDSLDVRLQVQLHKIIWDPLMRRV